MAFLVHVGEDGVVEDLVCRGVFEVVGAAVGFCCCGEGEAEEAGGGAVADPGCCVDEGDLLVAHGDVGHCYFFRCEGAAEVLAVGVLDVVV